MAIPAPLSVDNLEGGCAVVVSTASVPRHRTSPRREAWRCLCVAMTAIALAACGSKPTVPQKIEMEFEVTTAGSINPDVNGRSSPLVLVIMQLRAQDKFASADFFSLFDPDAAILGDDLLGERDQLFHPCRVVAAQRSRASLDLVADAELEELPRFHPAEFEQWCRHPQPRGRPREKHPDQRHHLRRRILRL